MIGIPFSGSKRNWVKKIESIVRDEGYTTTLEPFGGSCIISANLCNDGIIPFENAYINDYDRLFDGYGEFLDIKDSIVSECLDKGVRPVKHSSKGSFRIEKDGSRTLVPNRMLRPWEIKILQEAVSKVDPKWYRLLAMDNNFCYPIVVTHRRVRLEDFNLLCGRLQTDRQREFLDVIRRMNRDSLDWKDFLKKHGDRFGSGTLIIADPPYLNAKHVQYKSGMDESGMLEMLEALKSSECCFLFFGYDYEWLDNWLASNGLVGKFEFLRRNNFINNTYRRDYMCHVRRANA